MSSRDRTSEFKSTLQSISLKSSNLNPKPKTKLQQRTEFAKSAQQIAKDIQSTTAKLEKLAQLAKRKTLFDDRPIEISELTYIIKQDIASLNTQIAKLQTLSNPQKSNGKKEKGKLEEHNSNVIVMLQSGLAKTSVGFKDVLEIRTQNMKASQNRTNQFGYNSQTQSGPSSDSPLFISPKNAGPSRSGTPSILQPQSGETVYDSSSSKGKGRQDDFLTLDMGPPLTSLSGNPNQSYDQMQLLQQENLPDQSDSYYQSRTNAINQIENTIQELGGIFSQLATMVSMQADQVQRIDQDTFDVANNVEGAQRELLKYYASISSNRWLMLKVMGVLIMFFLIFVLVS